MKGSGFGGSYLPPAIPANTYIAFPFGKHRRDAAEMPSNAAHATKGVCPRCSPREYAKVAKHRALAVAR